MTDDTDGLVAWYKVGIADVSDVIGGFEAIIPLP